MDNNLGKVDLTKFKNLRRAAKTPFIKPLPAYKVVFVRHGQSIWNKSGKFSGWVDVPLNETGENEAKEAGRLLKKNGYHFDVAHTSMLVRATKTCSLVLENMGLADHTKTIKSWKINERHYGSL